MAVVEVAAATRAPLSPSPMSASAVAEVSIASGITVRNDIRHLQRARQLMSIAVSHAHVYKR